MNDLKVINVGSKGERIDRHEEEIYKGESVTHKLYRRRERECIEGRGNV
tara:strand:+ start:400 stop:546 length:147 start_codon:yes stop_codon:yes gene_type:complete